MGRDPEHWRPNVQNFTLQMLKDGLKGQGHHPDIDWVSQFPCRALDDKRIYVWFEAVIGYLFGEHRVGQKPRHARKVAGLLGRRGQDLLFHRQGQHPFPHDHLAGDPARLRRPSHPL